MTDQDHDRVLRHLRQAQRVAGMASWEATPHNEGLFWSAEIFDLIGWPRGSTPTPEEYLALIHPDDLPDFLEQRRAVLEDGAPCEMDFRLIRPDAVTVHLRAVAEWEELDGSRRLVGVVWNRSPEIHAQQHIAEMEAQRRLLLERLLVGEGSERSALAAHLHDGPLHRITAAALDIESVSLADPALDAAALDRVLHHLRSATESLRAILEGVEPTPETSSDLAQNLRMVADGLLPGISVQIDVGQDCVLNERTSRGTLEIAREALMNVRRHARAEHARVTVRRVEQSIVLEITDDGVGFEPEHEQVKPGHLGLTSMTERARVLGGSVSIQSRPGATTVRAELPAAPGRS